MSTTTSAVSALAGPAPVRRRGHTSVHQLGIRRLTTRIARSFWVAWAVTVALAAAMLVTRFALGHDNLLGTARLFDPRFEANVPTWLNTIALASAGVITLLIAVGKRSSGDAFAGRWTLLGSGFLYLSLDEAASLHELSIDFLPRELMGLKVPPHAWAIFGLAIALLVGVCFIGFLRHLPRRTTLWFVAGGAVYLMGGAGFELIEGALLSGGVRQMSPLYMTLALVEEAFEIGGILIYLTAALSYLADHVLHVTWRLDATSAESPLAVRRAPSEASGPAA